MHAVRKLSSYFCAAHYRVFMLQQLTHVYAYAACTAPVIHTWSAGAHL